MEEEVFAPGGWVKIHRKIVTWRWASSSNHMALFMQILLRANFKETKWRKEVILPGQLLTGSNQLSEWTGLTRSQVRRALKDLVDSGEVTIKTTNKYSIVSIAKWDSYQLPDHQATNKRPTNDQQVTTSNNDNNINNENNNIIKASPLCFLFDSRPDIQGWLNKGSHDTHLLLLKQNKSHHELYEQIEKAFDWAQKKGAKAESWLITFVNNKKFDGFGANKAQKDKVAVTPDNPTANPYKAKLAKIRAQGKTA